MIAQTLIFAVLLLIMWTIVILLVWQDGREKKKGTAMKDNDLISRSALLEKANDGSVCLFDIRNAPAVDAETVFQHLDLMQEAFDMAKSTLAPVRHGRWVTQWCDNNMIGHEYAECSVCGCSMLDTNQFWNSKYCPNCGAKMDGDGE